MKTRSSTFLAAPFIIVTAIFSWQFLLKARYDKLRDQVLAVPRITAHPLDDEATRFLESVKTAWDVQDRHCPWIITKPPSPAGLENSTAGIVALHTHEIREFSFFNPARNAQELARWRPR